MCRSARPSLSQTTSPWSMVTLAAAFQSDPSFALHAASPPYFLWKKRTEKVHARRGTPLISNERRVSQRPWQGSRESVGSSPSGRFSSISGGARTTTLVFQMTLLLRLRLLGRERYRALPHRARQCRFAAALDHTQMRV